MATDGMASRWNGVAYPAGSERRLDSVLLQPGQGVFSAVAGRRVGGNGLAVSVGGSPEAVTVTAGGGVIYDPAFAAAGPWIFEVPSNVPVPLPARPASGQSRRDLIVARVHDVDVFGSSARELKIERVPGEPAATPENPTPEPGSLVLATLTVPASGPIQVAQSPARSVAAGGVLPVQTTDQRDNLFTYAGMMIWNAQTSRVEVFNGTTWTALAPDQTFIDWTTLEAAAGWTRNNGPGITPRVCRVGTTCWYSGGFFGGTPNTAATYLPEWAWPSATIGPIRVVGHTNTTAIGINIWHTNGAFQPTANIEARITVSWPVN